MHGGCQTKPVGFFLFHAQFLCQDPCIFRNPPDVLSGLLTFVLCDLRKGEDHFLLDTAGFIRTALNEGPVFENVCKEPHQEKGDERRYKTGNQQR